MVIFHCYVSSPEGISCLIPTSELMCQWFFQMRDSTMVLSSNSGFPCKSSFNCKYSEQYTQNTLLKQTHTHTYIYIYIIPLCCSPFCYKNHAVSKPMWNSELVGTQWALSLRPRHFPIIQEVGSVTRASQSWPRIIPVWNTVYLIPPQNRLLKMGQVMINRLFFGSHIFRQLCLFHCLQAKLLRLILSSHGRNSILLQLVHLGKNQSFIPLHGWLRTGFP